MKLSAILLLAVVMLCGCKTQYDISTSSGAKITAIGKPKYIKESDEFLFTDTAGRKMYIKGSRVRVIEPHEESKTHF